MKNHIDLPVFLNGDAEDLPEVFRRIDTRMCSCGGVMKLLRADFNPVVNSSNPDSHGGRVRLVYGCRSCWKTFVFRSKVLCGVRDLDDFYVEKEEHREQDKANKSAPVTNPIEDAIRKREYERLLALEKKLRAIIFEKDEVE